MSFKIPTPDGAFSDFFSHFSNIFKSIIFFQEKIFQLPIIYFNYSFIQIIVVLIILIIHIYFYLFIIDLICIDINPV